MKIRNGGHYSSQITCLHSYMILTIKNYQYTKFHATIHMHNKVIESLSFSVAAILKIQNGGHYCSQITCLHSDIIVTIKNYLYTKYHANFHMHNKVIEFFSFQWRPFENSKWRPLQQPDHVSSFLISF